MKRHFVFFAKYFLPLFIIFFIFLSHPKTTLAASQATPSYTPARRIAAPIPTGYQAVPAQVNSPMQYPLNTNPDVEQNLNTYTQSVFIEILSTASCFLAGRNPVNPNARCLGYDQTTGKLGYINEDQAGGLMGMMGGLIGSTYKIPVSSSQYIAYLASNFGITRTSYAQTFGNGPGFHALSSVIRIWTTFRNVTYVLFVFIFIVLGLGIMFRVNIDARTVMTIQNQIPKIIIALILITFSYAIVGFLIDMMYLSMYLVVNLFRSNNLTTVNSLNVSPFSAIGGFGGIGGIANPPASSIGASVGTMFDGTFGDGLGGLFMRIFGAFAGGLPLADGVSAIGKVLSLTGGLGSFVSDQVGNLTDGLSSAFLGSIASSKVGPTTVGSIVAAPFQPGGVAKQGLMWIAYIIVYLVIVIALLLALFRTWIMLIKSYVYLLLGVVLSPFWIMGGLLPGGIGGFGPWIRSIISNIAVFPMVLILMLIGQTIQTEVVGSANRFTPPMIGEISGDPGAMFASIIGLGIILIMPESLNLVKSMLKAPNIGGMSGAAAGALGFGLGAVTSPFTRAVGHTFSNDALGRPREGKRWASNLIKNRLGASGQKVVHYATGGAISHPDEIKRLESIEREEKERDAARKRETEEARPVAIGEPADEAKQPPAENPGGSGGGPSSPASPPSTGQEGNDDSDGGAAGKDGSGSSGPQTT